MRAFLFPALSLLICLSTKANDKDSTIYYTLPDSVKAVQFMAEIEVRDMNATKRFTAGIRTDLGSLYFVDRKGKRSFSFRMHEYSRRVSKGEGVKDVGLGGFYFQYNWQPGTKYKLMVALAADSAAQVCLYSAYIFLPELNKWKFIGTRKHPFYHDRLLQPSVFVYAHKKSTPNLVIGDAWCQRSTGSWKYMKEGSPLPPTINYFGHVDSVIQRQADTKVITDAITAGKTDAKDVVEGVFYKMIKEGTGKNVLVTDTVTAYYRVTLFGDTATIDQAKDKPATFPLKRLIRGWQIGVPLCKVGGKIKLVIPSDLAYSIRTRSGRIPPNSILEFEIEVVEAKSPQ